MIELKNKFRKTDLIGRGTSKSSTEQPFFSLYTWTEYNVYYEMSLIFLEHIHKSRQIHTYNGYIRLVWVSEQNRLFSVGLVAVVADVACS